MSFWAVRVYSDEVAFEATIMTEASDAGTAREKVQELTSNLKVARQLGPMSWEHVSLLIGHVWPATIEL